MKEGKNKECTAAILEYPFDFGRYIEERLREIDDSNERHFAKDLLLNGLGKAICCTEHKYDSLEQKVYEEIETKDNKYEIAITIIEKEKYNPDNMVFYPVYSDDLKDKEQMKSDNQEGGIYLGTIFLEMDDEEILKCQDFSPFYGTILGENGEQAVLFRIQASKKYKTVVEKLYHVFQDNHILWTTVNMGYLNKFYDVFIQMPLKNLTTDFYKQEISISDCNIWFGEFSNNIKYDIIPVWNIKCINFQCNNFMKPCIDNTYYEHEFSLDDKEEKDGYLVCFNNDIMEIRQEKKRIVIKSYRETFEDWSVLHIIQKKNNIQEYYGPILTNHKKDSFLRRYSESSRVHFLTKADLFRRIMELDIRDYIEVSDYEIRNDIGNYLNPQNMNWFVKDELFPMESRKVLLLKFKERQQGYYLNSSMVQFVISQMQLEINEYCCVGVIE